MGNSYVTCSLCDNGIGGIFTAVLITTCVLQALSKQQQKNTISSEIDASCAHKLLAY